MVILFKHKPSILATSSVVGPLEGKSVFKSYFDYISDDEFFNLKTHEQAQAKIIHLAWDEILKKGELKEEDIEYFLSGDLVNQMTPTNLAARELSTAFIGLFSACATSVSSLIIAALLTELGASKHAIAGATSHHNATERQFRYPVLYGGQKPATAQWTVTAGGYALVGKHKKGMPSIVAATFGHVIDYDVKDPFHMGGAMAPAAYDTITRHLEARKQKLEHYDIIMTGDLGKVGLQILKGCFMQSGQSEGVSVIRDAGAEFYGEDSFFLAGASGAGCSAAVFFSYAMAQFASGRYKRGLFVATGALLSPLTFQQGESIPSIAHAVELCVDEGD